MPGTVVSIAGTGANGPNILLVERPGHRRRRGDGGLRPGAPLGRRISATCPRRPGKVPQCSNGIDDNHNSLIDFPSDPGCYAADDDTEDGGTYAAGVSPGRAVHAAQGLRRARSPGGRRAHAPTPTRPSRSPSRPRPTSSSPASPARASTSRDLNPAEVDDGYNSLYAFNFSVPDNMRLCDQVTSLSGTANDFYGFTQLSFPAYSTTYTVLGAGRRRARLRRWHPRLPGARAPAHLRELLHRRARTPPRRTSTPRVRPGAPHGLQDRQELRARASPYRNNFAHGPVQLRLQRRRGDRLHLRSHRNCVARPVRGHLRQPLRPGSRVLRVDGLRRPQRIQGQLSPVPPRGAELRDRQRLPGRRGRRAPPARATPPA